MKLKQSVALQRISKSFIERLYEDGKLQEAFMAEHINQLYDYLSDKEDGRYYILDRRIAKSEDIDKDMGECVCSFQHLNNGEVNASIRSDCPVHNPFPPQQEEFYGEGLSEEAKLDMRIRNTRLNEYIESKKSVKEESPKEDDRKMSKSHETSNQILRGQKKVEKILLKHIGTVNSFVDDEGYNHFNESCQDIAIALHTLYED